MVKKFSSAISHVLNPLLMPTILFVILFYFTAFIGNTMSDKQMLYVLFIIFILTFLLPACCVMVLKITHNISSLKLHDKRERLMPYFIISMIYLLTTYLFFAKIKINSIFFVILVTITVLMVILTLITYFWKISTQSAAVCSIIGFLLGISYKYPQDKLLFPLIILILLAGIIMSSKLYLNENNHKEIYFGSALGFIFSFSAVYFFT